MERFKEAIGGVEKMNEFMLSYVEEHRTGRIRQINMNKQHAKPWLQFKPHSTYAMSLAKYKDHKKAIELLSDVYLKIEDEVEEQAEKRRITSAGPALLQQSTGPGRGGGSVMD